MLRIWNALADILELLKTFLEVICFNGMLKTFSFDTKTEWDFNLSLFYLKCRLN